MSPADAPFEGRRPLFGPASPVPSGRAEEATAPTSLHTPEVDSERAQLSSARTTLDDLVVKVADIAEAMHGGGQDALAHDLFEVERALRMAQRRLDAVTRRMRR